MQSEMMIMIGAIAIGLGVLVSALYYFARYKIKTDHEEDQLVKVTEAKPSAAAAPVVESKAEKKTENKVEPKFDKPTTTLSSAMSKTRESFWGRLGGVFRGRNLDDGDRDAIEEILYSSDLGPHTVRRLMETIQEKSENLNSLDALKSAFKIEFQNILTPVKSMGVSPLDGTRHKPEIWMVVGVNGAGKTTTIGKLAHAAAQKGLKVLVAAGDTFRAAAQEQLKIWTDRASVEIFAPEGVTEPAAVAFEACQIANAKGYDLVILDTAGRLHTQKNLMEELKKVKRVMQKANADAPHEVLIVLDANSGQNALVQAREFNEALGLTGAVVTKMDGTAKGGVVLGLAEELKIPTRLIGVGEGVLDLKTFSVDEYVASILG